MVLDRYSRWRPAGVGSRDCVDLDCVRAFERGERAYELYDSAVSCPRNGQSPETLRTLADRGIRENVDSTLSKHRAAPDSESGHVHECAGVR